MWVIIFLIFFIPQESVDKFVKFCFGFLILYYFAEFTEWIWAGLKAIF